MNPLNIPVAAIDVRPDARPIDAKIVASIAASIEALGLMNPIRVRPVGGRWQVIAGGHRLAAFRSLGRETIPCVVVDVDDRHAELQMLDENLCRAELSPADRARQTARRKAIYEALHPQAKRGTAGAIASNGVQGRATAKSAVASFVTDTAIATGKAERTVRLDAERGEKVHPDALAVVRGTPLDKGAYLDKLKTVPRDEQALVAKRDVEEATRGAEARKAGSRGRRGAPPAAGSAPAALSEPASNAARSHAEQVLAIWASASAADRQAIVAGLREAIRAEASGRGTVASGSHGSDVFSSGGRTSYAPPVSEGGAVGTDATMRDLKAKLRAEKLKAKDARLAADVAKTLLRREQSENSRLRDELHTARYELARLQNKGKATVVNLFPVPPSAAPA